VLQSTKGVATEYLTAAAKRAQLGLAARCRGKGINDFSLRTRLHRALIEPIPTFRAEVWAPRLLPTLEYALASPLQRAQTDFLAASAACAARPPFSCCAPRPASPPCPVPGCHSGEGDLPNHHRTPLHTPSKAARQRRRPHNDTPIRAPSPASPRTCPEPAEFAPNPLRAPRGRQLHATCPRPQCAGCALKARHAP
jgi:hypothetical protein